AALAEVLAGPFSTLVRRDLSVDFLRDPLLLAGIAGFAVLVGILAAIYPALVLSSFRPATVLKARLARSSRSPLGRVGLVSIQFAVLVGLILATATIYRQTQFALARGIGAAYSQRIVGVFDACRDGFVEEVRKLPGVSAVACSTQHAMSLAKLTN